MIFCETSLLSTCLVKVNNFCPWLYTHWTLMFPHLDITYEYVYWTFSKHTVYAFFIPTSNSYWWIENCPIVNSNELWLRQKILLLKRNCLFKSKLCFYWARSWPNRSLKNWWDSCCLPKLCCHEPRFFSLNNSYQ